MPPVEKLQKEHTHRNRFRQKPNNELKQSHHTIETSTTELYNKYICLDKQTRRSTTEQFLVINPPSFVLQVVLLVMQLSIGKLMGNKQSDSLIICMLQRYMFMQL